MSWHVEPPFVICNFLFGPRLVCQQFQGDIKLDYFQEFRRHGRKVFANGP